MTLADNFVRPDLGLTLGFVGERGTQAAHLIGQTKLWGQLNDSFLIARLNAGLSAGDPAYLDVDGRWNGVLLPAGAEESGSGRDLTEKAGAVLGVETHRGLHVGKFDELWFDKGNTGSSRFLNVLNSMLEEGDITAQQGRVQLKNFIDTMKVLTLDQSVLDRMFGQDIHASAASKTVAGLVLNASSANFETAEDVSVYLQSLIDSGKFNYDTIVSHPIYQAIEAKGSVAQIA